jgi:hypothetical protein
VRRVLSVAGTAVVKLPAKLVLSTHAVDRYHQRWRPGWKRKDAEAELQAHLATARSVEVDEYDLIYQTCRGALLVVANEGSEGVVRTVLPMWSKKTNRRPRR